jgi:hypothetical protein
MQHELFVHPNKGARLSYPLIVVLHADIAEGEERIVAPLAVAGPPSRVRPRIRHDGNDFIVLMRLLGLVPIRLLRQPLGSIASYRDDLTRALDWLICRI